METLYYFDDEYAVNLYENEEMNLNIAKELVPYIHKEVFQSKDAKSGFIKAMHFYCDKCLVLTKGQYNDIHQYFITKTKKPEKLMAADVCSDIMDAPNNKLPVFVFDIFTGNLHDVMDVDTTITDRIDININTEKLPPYYVGWMETYFQIASQMGRMELDQDEDQKQQLCHDLTWKFEKKYQNYDWDVNGGWIEKIDEFIEEEFTTDQDKRMIATLKDAIEKKCPHCGEQLRYGAHQWVCINQLCKGYVEDVED